MGRSHARSRSSFKARINLILFVLNEENFEETNISGFFKHYSGLNSGSHEFPLNYVDTHIHKLIPHGFPLKKNDTV